MSNVSLDGIIPFAMLKKNNNGNNNGFNFDDLTEEQKKQLKGEKGDKGDKGNDGKSAYQIWLEEGNIGSEQDFLNSLKGEKGDDGEDVSLETLNTLQTKIDDKLNTNNKSIVGAINEINQQLDNGVQSNLISGDGIDINNNIIKIKIDNNTLFLNENGELEVKISSDGSDEGNKNIKQYIIKDVKSGQTYIIKDDGLPINQKLVTSIMALQQQETYSNEITNFKINEEDISSNNGIYINNLYTINVKNGISEIIDTSQFLKPILNLKGVL